MVKNAGGNKSKKQARKSAGGVPNVTQNVRYVAETGELYAVITTIHGGKTCQVMCDDGISRRCTIRRKFMTARRGDNAIAPGTWLMVGLYDWEKRADGSQTCDILEVYSAAERDKLKQTVNAKVLKHLVSVNNTMEGNKSGSEFIFSDTLADIDAEEDADSEEDGEESMMDQPTKKIIPLKDLPITKTTVNEQLDWLNISADDI